MFLAADQVSRLVNIGRKVANVGAHNVRIDSRVLMNARQNFIKNLQRSGELSCKHKGICKNTVLLNMQAFPVSK